MTSRLALCSFHRKKQWGENRDRQGPQEAGGIALAPEGKLIVAEVGAKRIVEIDPQNANVKEIAGNLPIGLPARRVADQYSDRRRGRVVRHDLLLVRHRERDLQDREEIGRQAQVQPPRLGSAPPVRAQLLRG
jgi:hypothetical protein